jgi:hypothetical protein
MGPAPEVHTAPQKQQHKWQRTEDDKRLGRRPMGAAESRGAEESGTTNEGRDDEDALPQLPSLPTYFGEASHNVVLQASARYSLLLTLYCSWLIDSCCLSLQQAPRLAFSPTTGGLVATTTIAPAEPPATVQVTLSRAAPQVAPPGGHQHRYHSITGETSTLEAVAAAPPSSGGGRGQGREEAAAPSDASKSQTSAVSTPDKDRDRAHAARMPSPPSGRAQTALAKMGLAPSAAQSPTLRTFPAIPYWSHVFIKHLLQTTWWRRRRRARHCPSQLTTCPLTTIQDSQVGSFVWFLLVSPPSNIVSDTAGAPTTKAIGETTPPAAGTTSAAQRQSDGASHPAAAPSPRSRAAAPLVSYCSLLLCPVLYRVPVVLAILVATCHLPLTGASSTSCCKCRCGRGAATAAMPRPARHTPRPQVLLR